MLAIMSNLELNQIIREIAPTVASFSAVNFISPPILLIYIALGCCVAKRLFVQKWFKR